MRTKEDILSSTLILLLLLGFVKLSMPLQAAIPKWLYQVAPSPPSSQCQQYHDDHDQQHLLMQLMTTTTAATITTTMMTTPSSSSKSIAPFLSSFRLYASSSSSPPATNRRNDNRQYYNNKTVNPSERVKQANSEGELRKRSHLFVYSLSFTTFYFISIQCLLVQILLQI